MGKSEWLWDKNTFVAVDHLCENLSCLQWARANGCPWDVHAFLTRYHVRLWGSWLYHQAGMPKEKWSTCDSSCCCWASWIIYTWYGLYILNFRHLLHLYKCVFITILEHTRLVSVTLKSYNANCITFHLTSSSCAQGLLLVVNGNWLGRNIYCTSGTI